ncbi:MAG: hypothetical protein HY925_02535 [Elusimicrobia bacterium]|nr:hypothetical protein [Elusimicrobiota bacterium]
MEGFAPDKRLAALAILAVFGLGIYVGVDFLRKPADPEMKTLKPEAGMPAAIPSRAASYADFMRAFSSVAERPAAQEFAHDFMARPELARRWRLFEEDKDVDAMSEDMKDSGDFKAVLAEQKDNPGFPEVVERALGEAPQLGRVLFSEHRPPDGPVILAPAATAPALVPFREEPKRVAAPKSVVLPPEAAPFASVFSMVDARTRDGIVEAMSSGVGPLEACRRSNAVAKCQTAIRRCQADAGCWDWLLQEMSKSKSEGKPQRVFRPAVNSR